MSQQNMKTLDITSQRIIAVAILFFSVAAFIFSMSTIPQAHSENAYSVGKGAICISPDGKYIYYIHDNNMYKVKTDSENIQETN